MSCPILRTHFSCFILIYLRKYSYCNIINDSGFESIFKMNPSDAKSELDNWYLLSTTNFSWNSIKENVKNASISLNPTLTKLFSGKNNNLIPNAQKPICESLAALPPPKLQITPNSQSTLFNNNLFSGQSTILHGTKSVNNLPIKIWESTNLYFYATNILALDSFRSNSIEELRFKDYKFNNPPKYSSISLGQQEKN